METRELSTNVRLVTPAKISFEGVNELKEEIKRLSEHMQTVEVTEENIQQSKKLLAKVRKEWNALEDQRKAVKKEVLKPYDELDTMLKEMKQILEAGETTISTQLDAIRERERKERLAELHKMFDDAHKAHKAPNWLDFDKFITSRIGLVNNKATSKVKKVNEIKTFFEKYKDEYAKVKEQFPLEDERTAILLSYSMNGLDMDKAISSYQSMIAEKERLRQAQELAKKSQRPTININQKPVKQVVTPKIVTFELADSKDYELLIKLMNQNNIKFTEKK